MSNQSKPVPPVNARRQVPFIFLIAEGLLALAAIVRGALGNQPVLLLAGVLAYVVVTPCLIFRYLAIAAAARRQPRRR